MASCPDAISSHALSTPRSRSVRPRRRRLRGRSRTDRAAAAPGGRDPRGDPGRGRRAGPSAEDRALEPAVSPRACSRSSASAGHARRRARRGRRLHRRAAGARGRPEGGVYAQNNQFILERFAEKPWSERLAKPVMKNVVRLDREFDDPLPPEAEPRRRPARAVLPRHRLAEADRAKMNAPSSPRSGPAASTSSSTTAPGRARARRGGDAAPHRGSGRGTRSGGRLQARGEGDFLRNPADTRDWNASPRAAGERRGTSDRFVLKFVKPGK